ncbi:uncharacterized protein LOC116672627 isoform X2 [Etheostoma spectabile]|uniref:uncharacterized protein LOC116672627 isoform X2 n=1 Tax=Etheostoma spectabile TaxID=54343 RepID=UPI0013AFC149|nr:uncharacterized protein LOC116672627 isoform X2 [Etheostoma spectabile]
MEACRSLLKSALVVIVLVAMFQSGSAEKLATCCKKVTKQEITEPILGYLVQRADPPCVQAVIFQTKSGLFCSYVRAPWVHRKVAAFERAKAQAAASSVAPSTPVSLLSVITSTASLLHPPPSFLHLFSPSFLLNFSCFFLLSPSFLILSPCFRFHCSTCFLLRSQSFFLNFSCFFLLSPSFLLLSPCLLLLSSLFPHHVRDARW